MNNQDQNQRRADRRAELARMLEKIQNSGGTARDIDDIITETDRDGIAAAATLADGKSIVITMNPDRLHIGEIITMPGAPAGEDARRAVYGCRSCGNIFLNIPPRPTDRPGDILPRHEAERKCGACTDADALETAARAALETMPPASLSMN